MVVIRIAIVLVIWSLLRKVANKPPRRVVTSQKAVSAPIAKPRKVEPIKHEPTFAERQAEEDVEYLLTVYIPNLDAMLDIAQGELASANSIAKQEKYLKKVNSLQKQIRTAEKQLAKAREVLE